MQSMAINIMNVKFPVQMQENLKEHQLTQKYAEYNQKNKTNLFKHSESGD